MIESICLPARPTDWPQVESTLHLLRYIQKLTKEKVKTGMQVVGLLSDFTDSGQRKLMIENLARARSEGLGQIVIHAPWPSPDELYEPKLNMAKTDQSLSTFQGVVDMAREVNAEMVVMHSGVWFQWWTAEKLSNQARNALYNSVSQTLRKLDREGIKIGLENMPYPGNGDVNFGKNQVVIDPLFTDLGEMYEFAQENEVEIVFDTCHWGTLNLPISLAAAFRRIESKVCNIHLSDVGGRWLPGVSLFQEGLVPGDGDLGEQNFRWFLAHIKHSKKPVILTIEVKDKDFIAREESRRAIHKIYTWLAS